MKHLILDINIVLDLWLKRGDYQIIDNLLEVCDESGVKLWFPSSALGTVDYILVRELAKEGVPRQEAKEMSRQLLLLLLADVSLLSCLGFEQTKAVEKAYDLEDAQIALAAAGINGEKRFVTFDKTFDTLGLIETAEPYISNRVPLHPAAIIAVDLFGLLADYDPIMEIAREHDLFVLEDAAQGLGGMYKGKSAGILGHLGCTSFFPAKPLGCYGDGGAIFTDDEELVDICRSIRVHGKGTGSRQGHT